MPAWPLRVHIVGESLKCSATAVQGVVELSNYGDRLRRMALGMAVARGGEMKPSSISNGTIQVYPDEVSTFAFHLVPFKPLAELLIFRIFAANEGMYGFVGKPLLFGRRSASP
jgi:hypothetical protein